MVAHRMRKFATVYGKLEREKSREGYNKSWGKPLALLENIET